MTDFLYGLSIPFVSVFIVSIMFSPFLNLLNWRESIKSINWEIPILFTTGFSIAKAFQQNNLINDLSTSLISRINIQNMLLTLLLYILFLVIVRLFFTNFNTSVATLFPFVLIVGEKLPFNNIWFGLISLYILSMIYILPTQSIGNMLYDVKEILCL